MFDWIQNTVCHPQFSMCLYELKSAILRARHLNSMNCWCFSRTSQNESGPNYKCQNLINFIWNISNDLSSGRLILPHVSDTAGYGKGCDVQDWYWLNKITLSSRLQNTWWRHQMETFSALLAICAGEFTGHRWIPRTKASDAELWCFIWSAPEWTIE